MTEEKLHELRMLQQKLNWLQRMDANNFFALSTIQDGDASLVPGAEQLIAEFRTEMNRLIVKERNRLAAEWEAA